MRADNPKCIHYMRTWHTYIIWNIRITRAFVFKGTHIRSVLCMHAFMHTNILEMQHDAGEKRITWVASGTVQGPLWYRKLPYCGRAATCAGKSFTQNQIQHFFLDDKMWFLVEGDAVIYLCTQPAGSHAVQGASLCIQHVYNIDEHVLILD